MTESMDKTSLSTITFVSENEISIEQSGLLKPRTFTFIRKPLPELPFMARARPRRDVAGAEFYLYRCQKT